MYDINQMCIRDRVHAKDKARVIRDGIVIRTAEIGALKIAQEDSRLLQQVRFPGQQYNHEEYNLSLIHICEP